MKKVGVSLSYYATREDKYQNKLNQSSYANLLQDWDLNFCQQEVTPIHTK